MAPLALRVRELRVAQDISQAELAERAGVRQATISAIERGTTTRIDLDVLERLGKALGVAPGLLITETR